MFWYDNMILTCQYPNTYHPPNMSYWHMIDTWQICHIDIWSVECHIVIQQICQYDLLHDIFMWWGWRSDITHVNKSCRTHKLSVVRMNESCHTCECAMSHMWMCHVVHVNVPCRTCECAMSHMWMCHVTSMNVSWHTAIAVCSCLVVSHKWISRVTHMVVSHKWMSCVTHMNASCHTVMAMRSHPMRRHLQENACYALRSLCHNNDANKKRCVLQCVAVYFRALQCVARERVLCAAQFVSQQWRQPKTVCVTVCCSVL